MIRDLGFKIYEINVDVKFDDLGGGRCRVLGFYIDGKRCVPAHTMRDEVYKRLGAAIRSEWKGKFELVDILPALKNDTSP
jgi:hypothetical protein